jgi:hypothetical protein
MKIARETLIKKIRDTKGKFFSVRFVKKNGEVRDMNCRLGVTKYLQGKGRSHPKSLINTYDVQVEGYRYINCKTIQQATIKGVTYEC